MLRCALHGRYIRRRAAARTALLVACFLIWLAQAQGILAHAEYLRSLPAADSDNLTAPAQVQVWFSENIAPPGSALSVRDGRGAAVDNGDSHVAPDDPTELIVTLRPLPPGIYTVLWRNTSQDDGHASAGSFPFTVGAVRRSPSYTSLMLQVDRAQRALQLPPPASALVSFLVITSLILLVGTLAFRPLLLSQPDLREFADAVKVPLHRLAGVSLALAWFATAVAAAMLMASLGMFVGRVITVLLARFLLLALLSAVYWRRREHSRWVLVPALALLLTQSLLSHSAAEAQPLAPVMADWVHLAFTALWLGGVAVLAIVVAPAALASPAHLKALGSVIARFSPLAMFSIFAIALTGIAQSAAFVGSFEALLNTAYGRAILVKVGWLLVLAAFGAFHQQVVAPHLQGWRLRDPQGMQRAEVAARRFVFGIIAETLVSLALLATVAVLVSLPPARDVSANPAVPAAIQIGRSGNLSLALGIAPARAGVNLFELAVQDGGDVSTATASHVTLRFSGPVAGAGITELPLVPHGEGVYVAQSGVLSMSGHWQVTAVVRQPGGADVTAVYRIDLP